MDPSAAKITAQQADDNKRQKRSTRYSGDFQVTFGDAISSDEEKDNKRKSVGSGAKAKRSKECPGCGAVLPLSSRECRLCDYQFTSKSMTMNPQSQVQESAQVREKFLFEPERDEDGSLFIQAILGRRPRKSGKRLGGVSLNDVTAMDAKYEYEYLIKYKNLSYLHVQWLSANDIEAMSHKSKSVLQRYLTKLDKGDSTVADDVEIDPSYMEVEKILDYREEEVHEVVDDVAPPPSNNYKSTSPVKDGASSATTTSQEIVQDDSKAPSASTGTSANGVAPKTADIKPTLLFESEEVVASTNKIFQPVERCKRVLEKIWEDPYAASFQDPVDVSLYDDYLDVVEEPMCLKDVKQKLAAGEYSKYGLYTRFAVDMRKIWRNCKLYNLYKSQIWHSAHALSMMFERLYQAWVVSFADGSIPLTDPLGNPWESACRNCLEEINDEQMMLCDHCDAAHHIYCLQPPLSKVPEEAWMCARCTTWLAKTGAKVLSANAEEEARQQVDGAATRKIVKTKKKKYLVKWRGLSYRDCTWETAKDINDDAKITEYHQLNDSPPDEPPLTQAEIGLELAKDRKMQLNPSGTNMTKENPVADMDAQIYAQIRTYHFLKWNKLVPSALLRESGPAAYSYVMGARCPMALSKSALMSIRKTLVSSSKEVADDEMEVDGIDQEGDEEKKKADELAVVSKIEDDEEEKASEKKVFDKTLGWYLPTADTDSEDETKDEAKIDTVKDIVAELLCEAVYSVARDHQKVPIAAYPSRPPLPSRYKIPSEVEICVPKGTKSLYMKVACFHNDVVVAGFKPVDEKTGAKGPVELTNRIRVGDLLVAINGLYVYDLKFQKILKLLNSIQHAYVYLRFLRIPPCLEARKANSIQEYMERKRPFRSIKLFPVRSLYRGVYPNVEKTAMLDDSVKTEQVAGGAESKSEEADSSEPMNVEKAVDTVPNVIVAAVKSSSATKPVPSVDLKNITWVAEYYNDHDLVSLGKFDSEAAAARAYDDAIKKLGTRSSNVNSILNFKEDGSLTADAQVIHNIVSKERLHNSKFADMNYVSNIVLSTDALASHEAKSRSNMLKENVEDLDDFRSQDSRDSETIVGVAALPEVETSSSSASDLDEDDDDDDEDDNDSEDNNVQNNSWDSGNEDVDWMPGKEKAGYDNDGPVARLLRAVNESDYAPIKSDWSRYIIEMGIVKDTTNRSKKIEQIDMATGNRIRVWDSVNAASRTLNIPAADILAALTGDGSDTVAAGFKWKPILLDSTNDADDDDNADDMDLALAEETWKSKLPTKSQEYKNEGTLRDYQVEGLSWLLRCWYTKRSSILADEMGLGKTVQVVTFLEHLFTIENIKGPFLICVPLSTIGHWKREFENWTYMICCIYHDVGGGRDMRDVIREYEWYFKDRSRRVLKFHVLITTYDDLVRDYEELAEIPWRVVIVDEAHRLRNVNSKLLECMRSVVTKGLVAYGYQHRILMTGTPLQNNTIELWSLLNFIEPAKFPDLEKFQQRFGNIQTQEQVENLQRRIAPHLLRRVKEDVAKDIPPKAETIIDVELTTMQKQYYRAIFERNHGFLMQNLKGNLPKLMNIQMELRKCCNHPFLIHGVEQNEMENLDKIIEEEQKNVSTKTSTSKQYLLEQRRDFERRRMDQYLIPASGKMVLLDKLLPKLRKEGHKVLLFSQMVKMIDIIDEFCEMRKYPCERLDGRVSGNDRQKAIDRYHKDPDSFVFLLSTRAGGVGINLTAADTVIIFDSDWNPQNDIQAMARCHRIGQSKNVTIYRLITRRSFESEMFQRASKKLGLEQAVLGTRSFNDTDLDENAKNNAKVDAKEMEQLLREGAYAVLLEDDTDMVKEFYEQDIDKILEQRSHVIITDAGSGGPGKGTESWLNKRKKSGHTSKSMFTGESAKEHAEIDVNDPDFWKKVLPDLVTPDLMLERLKDVDAAAHDEDADRGERGELLEKYMKDLSQMMDGMLDLNRRNQLPERERAVCMKLLLRITLKEDSFEEEDREKAQEWLSFMEGTRVRRSRQDVYSAEDFKHSKSGQKAIKKLRGKAAALAKLQQQLLVQQQQSSSKGSKKKNVMVIADDDDHMDEDDGEDDDDDGDADEDEDGSSGEEKATNNKSSSAGGSSKKKSSLTPRQLKKKLEEQAAKKLLAAANKKKTPKKKAVTKDIITKEDGAVSAGKRKLVKKSLVVDGEDGEEDSGEVVLEDEEEKLAKPKRRRLSAKQKAALAAENGEGDGEDAPAEDVEADGKSVDPSEKPRKPRKPRAPKDSAVAKKIRFTLGNDGDGEDGPPEEGPTPKKKSKKGEGDEGEKIVKKLGRPRTKSPGPTNVTLVPTPKQSQQLIAITTDNKVIASNTDTSTIKSDNPTASDPNVVDVIKESTTEKESSKNTLPVTNEEDEIEDGGDEVDESESDEDGEGDEAVEASGAAIDVVDADMESLSLNSELQEDEEDDDDGDQEEHFL